MPLVPLPRIAKRLGVTPTLLVQLAQKARFPQVFEIAPNVLRVDAEAVERWLRERDVRELAKRRHDPEGACP